MKINIYNSQKSIKISKRSIQKQIKAVLQSENVNCDELSLYLIDEKSIKKLHKDFFNDDTSTDCISFPIDSPEEFHNYSILGEVFVCPEVAIRYSKEHDISSYDETTLYIIHGLLHLLGYDDISEKDKTTMRKKEKKCMSVLKAMNLGICKKHTKQLMENNE